MQKKILILNFGGIGDQILFLPVFETLRQRFKSCFITLVTESRSRAISELTDLIDEVFICDLKGKNRILELIRFFNKVCRNKYDVVISSGTSQFIPIILFLTGIKERTGYDSGVISRVLLSRAVKLNKDQYAADMYHDLVGKSHEIPRLGLTPSLGMTDNRKTIVIHPGASKLSVEKGIIKYWPTDNWLTLIEKLLSTGEYRVILTGGPDDAEILKEFEKYFPENIFQTNNLREFAHLVSESDMLVCVDSAPMHIGVGLRKRVIALFGPTDEKKLLPAGNPLFTAVKNDSLQCRPCLWDKRQTSCPGKDCLNIDPDYVFEIIKGAGVTGVFDSLNA